MSIFGTNRGLQTNRKPLRGGASGLVALVYLSNETATPSRDVKKKKYQLLVEIRPLLMNRMIGEAGRAVNIKKRRRWRPAPVYEGRLPADVTRLVVG